MTSHLDHDLGQLRALAVITPDRDAGELLLRLVGAAATLHERHALDRRGRCLLCRPASDKPWRWLRRRRPCHIHDAFSEFHLGEQRHGDHEMHAPTSGTAERGASW